MTSGKARPRSGFGAERALPVLRFAAVPLVLCWHASDAHHGIANFDLNSDIELHGVLDHVEFLNPHSWLYLAVTDANGNVVDWRCEMRGATVLKRSGWSETMFVPGTPITVTGSPDRRDPATCYLGTATFADGSSVDRYGQLQAPNAEAGDNRPARLASGPAAFCWS